MSISSNYTTAMQQFIINDLDDKRLLRYENNTLECVLLSQTKWYERIFAKLGFGPLHLRTISKKISKETLQASPNIQKKIFQKLST